MWKQANSAIRHGCRKISRLANDESGVTSIEYALIGALIAVVIVASVMGTGQAANGLWEFVAREVAAAVQN
ncbi:Flp family type IVb pilin [Propionivibrio limicola]|uniref:Flp family type IVb pilin n=1 Tax=Propionivibrio limicola TaxID=167645 RepID=UPI00129192CA|nr:Flp family type IVb pilin [Propionivibrio limicola]